MDIIIAQYTDSGVRNLVVGSVRKVKLGIALKYAFGGPNWPDAWGTERRNKRREAIREMESLADLDYGDWKHGTDLWPFNLRPRTKSGFFFKTRKGLKKSVWKRHRFGGRRRIRILDTIRPSDLLEPGKGRPWWSGLGSRRGKYEYGFSRLLWGGISLMITQERGPDCALMSLRLSWLTKLPMDSGIGRVVVATEGFQTLLSAGRNQDESGRALQRTKPKSWCKHSKGWFTKAQKTSAGEPKVGGGVSTIASYCTAENLWNHSGGFRFLCLALNHIDYRSSGKHGSLVSSIKCFEKLPETKERGRRGSKKNGLRFHWERSLKFSSTEKKKKKTSSWSVSLEYLARFDASMLEIIARPCRTRGNVLLFF